MQMWGLYQAPSAGQLHGLHACAAGSMLAGPLASPLPDVYGCLLQHDRCIAGSHVACILPLQPLFEGLSPPADFWARYVRFLEGQDAAAAERALKRATGLFCQQRPEMHLFAAQFQERHGDDAAARASLQLVSGELAPTLIAGLMAPGPARHYICSEVALVPASLQLISRELA